MKENIGSALDKIVEKLGVAAHEILDTFTAAQPVKGGLILASIVLWLAGAILIANKMWGIASERQDGEVDLEDYITFTGVVIFIYSVFFLALSVIVIPALMQVLCPEYTAMKEILESLPR